MLLRVASVNVTRRVPTEKFILGAHVRGGSLGYFDLGANVGGKITDGLHFYAGGFLSGGKQWRSTNDKNRSLFASLSYTKGIHNLILRLEVVMTSTAPMRVLPLLWRPICIA